MIGKILRNKIQDKIWGYLKEFFYLSRVKDSPIIQNINYGQINNQKRALICYLPNGYFQAIDLKKIGRTIPFEIFKLVKVLSEFGFCIDIVGANDVKSLQIIKSKKYNLIFGFGESFYQITQLQPDAISILYMTENHPEISFRREQQRIDYFYERYHRNVKMERSGQFYQIKHLEIKYNHVIALGEIDPFRKQYVNPFQIFPTGIINSDFKFTRKDYLVTRKHFLWMGSSAVIHKGLDLLLDIFGKRTDIYLHICGLNNKSRKIIPIPDRSNIMDYGFVNINSETFLEIVSKCSFSILPSCSEGLATSITTSMLHGLVPVVNKNTGFDRLEEHAIFLDDFKVDYIDNVLSELVNFDPIVLEAYSRKVRDFALQNFQISKYEETLRSIFSEILEGGEERISQ